MKVAIMQPYLFPYIGYFQLINAVDEFIVYDNIEFTKKGWINRNRILVNGKDAYISFPLKKDSDYLNVNERYLSDNWPDERKKLLNKITELYRKGPHFKMAMPIIENAFLCGDSNLFQFILHTIKVLIQYLQIKTPLIISSTIDIAHSLKAENKVLEICKQRGADIYINPIGGIELYKKATFKNHGIDLFFLKTENIIYPQFNNTFIPFLSIIDVMMFNSANEIKNYLDNCFTLINKV